MTYTARPALPHSRHQYRAHPTSPGALSLPAITSVALQFAESLDLPVVLERIAQQAADLFGGVCRVHFTSVQRPADTRLAVAHPSSGAGGAESVMLLLARLDPPEPEVARPLVANGHRPAGQDICRQGEGSCAPGAALLVTPLLARGRRLGEIDVVLTAPDATSLRRNQLLLRTLAVHAALALDTADRVTHCGSGAEVDVDVSQGADLTQDLSLIAHDLRAPLTTLSLSLQLISRMATEAAALDHGRVARLASLATAAVEQLERQITALSPAPAASAQCRTPPAASVDLIMVARQLATFYQQTTSQHQITLSADVPALPGSWARPQLERVIGNLLTNAIKYSAAGSAIRVRVGQEEDELGHWATLRVDNQGPGIPMPDLAQITRAGYRARNVGDIPGMGLGLASVHEVVAQCGGSLVLQSDVGGTTEVLIRLPLTSTRDGPATTSGH